MLPDNETITFEDQLYVNPEASLKEQNAFIDNLRGIQNQNNAEINTQTTNLGTYPASQSNLGGLIGGEGYFTARYQTPQGVSLAANLDAVARAQAQNEVLNNQLSALKQRYSKAYKAARRRASSYGSDTTSDPQNPTTGGVDEEVSDKKNETKKVNKVETSLDSKSGKLIDRDKNPYIKGTLNYYTYNMLRQRPGNTQWT